MQLEKENEYLVFSNFSTFPPSLFLSQFRALFYTECLLPRSVDTFPLSIDLELDATVHTHRFTHETRMKIYPLPIFEYDFTISLFWVSMVDHRNLYGKTLLISPVIHNTA
jgi:hypothetical protein